eukprot:237018-Rhodomonas_salina.4
MMELTQKRAGSDRPRVSYVEEGEEESRKEEEGKGRDREGGGQWRGGDEAREKGRERGESGEWSGGGYTIQICITAETLC